MARRRWMADRWDEGTAALGGERAAHLVRVLRVRPGMQYEVVAGDRVRLGTVTAVSEDEVLFALGEELPRERALPLTLLVAIFKFDRLEWAIEKTTELGAMRVVPVVARRTEKHLAQAAGARVERWRRIAEQAARQSRRAELPIIDAPMPVQEAAALLPHATRVLLDENERERLLLEALPAQASELAVAVGPEGGWTDEERALFLAAGWLGVSLGPRILRAETAAMAAAAVAGAVLG